MRKMGFFAGRIRIAEMMILSCLVSGCAQNVPETNASFISLAPVSEEESSDYQYLTKTYLHGSGTSAAVYVIKSDSLRTGEDQVSSDSDGITEEVRFTKDASEFQRLSASIETNLSNADKISDYQKTSSDALNIYAYSIIENNVKYPCAEYLKIDQYDSDGYLLWHITVDNTKTTEKSTEVLNEAFSSAGIETG